MKTYKILLLNSLLIATLVLITEKPSFAVCGVTVPNLKDVSKIIGWNELTTALEKRHYYIRSEGYEDVELELSLELTAVQECYSNRTSLIQDAGIFFHDLFDSASSVDLIARYPKTGKEVKYHSPLPLYSGNGAQVRRAIRSMIRELPKCKSKLVNP